MRARKCVKIDIQQTLDDIKQMFRLADKYMFDMDHCGLTSGSIANIEQAINALDFFMNDSDRAQYNIRNYKIALGVLKDAYIKRFQKGVA